MRLWGRAWRVTLGDVQSSEIDLKFKVTRSLTPRPGTCELEVYNLSEPHRTAAAAAARRTFVQVEAGYIEGMALLFRGNARRIWTLRDGSNWITKVEAGDGEFAIRTQRAARAFGPDTAVEDVVRYCADAMGVGTGNAAETLRGAGLDRVGSVFPRGATLHGSTARELVALLRAAGLEWSVQDGVLQVLPRGGALDRQAIVLGPSTGLVGSPERGQHGVVKAKALLIPDLVPGRKVRLDSAIVAGVFTVTKAEYSGQTDGTEWYADLELRQVT